MKALLYTIATLILLTWAIGFLKFHSAESIHLLLLIDLLIILKILKPQKEERITRITSERNYIK